jgi:hypothetical protein
LAFVFGGSSDGGEGIALYSVNEKLFVPFAPLLGAPFTPFTPFGSCRTGISEAMFKFNCYKVSVSRSSCD